MFLLLQKAHTEVLALARNTAQTLNLLRLPLLCPFSSELRWCCEVSGYRNYCQALKPWLWISHAPESLLAQH